jgi:hypothetical protein
MVAVCCVVILGIGVSGICVSGLYPYSEITFSSISTFIDGETSDITIKTNQAPTLDLAFERLQIQIKNHNGAKNVTSLDES